MDPKFDRWFLSDSLLMSNLLFDAKSRSSRSELEVCYKCVSVSSDSVWVSS